jgi:two-component system, NarL family, response regulator DevR
MTDLPVDERQVKVLLVDDHEMVALGIKSLLETENGVEVVATVGTVKDAVAAVVRLQPDVVLMDYRLPDGTGAEAARAIMALEKAPGVVMATSVADRRMLRIYFQER